MPKFIKVCIDPAKDHILATAQIMFMRKDSSTCVEIEEDSLPRALALLGGNPKVCNKSLIVLDGRIKIPMTTLGIHSTYKIALKRLAEDQQRLIALCAYVSTQVPKVTSHGEYHIHLNAIPQSDAIHGTYDHRSARYLKFGDIILYGDLPHGSLTLFAEDTLRHNLDGLNNGTETYFIMEDDNGRIFAIYTAFNAWVLVNTSTSIDEDLYDVFKLLLNKMDSLVPDQDAFMQEQEEQERQEMLLRWGELVSGRHTQSVLECKELLKESHERVVRLRKEMTETLSGLPEIERVLQIASEITPDKTALAVEFSRIYENPWVENIEIDPAGEVMTVVTHELVMDGDEDIRTKMDDIREFWEGKLVPIGKFSIAISALGTVDIENLTNVHSDGERKWAHPHIPTDGAPCFGTIETSLPTLLSKYEFGAAIHLLTGFLTCCNADDAWGHNISLWKEDARLKIPESVATEDASTEPPACAAEAE